MKRFYTLLTATTLTAATTLALVTLPNSPDSGQSSPLMETGEAVKTPPYASTIAAAYGTFDQGWTVIDSNNDSKTWSAQSGSSGGSPSNLYAQYSYSGSNEGDDYLISPAIHLEADKEYVVMYGTKTNSKNYQERLTLYASTSTEPDAIKAATQLDKHEGGWTTFENCS